MKILRGFKDILIKKKELFNKIIIYFKNKSKKFYEIETPILENYNTFKKNNLFNNEIYKFLDYSNNLICLRPEGTSILNRIFSKYKKKLNLFYIGKMFRYEKPQKGKLREFKQFGIELLNSIIFEKVNIIIFFSKIIKRIKLFKLEINNFFNIKFKFYYIKIIILFLEKKILVNIKKNCIIKILENNNFYFKKFIFLFKFLKKKKKKILKKKLFLLNKAIFNPKLVRGIEYYSDIVFEFKNNKSICGGGGYSYFFNTKTKKIKNSFGFSIGVDRILNKKKIKKNKKLKIFFNFNFIYNNYKNNYKNKNYNIKFFKINKNIVKILYNKKSYLIFIKNVIKKIFFLKCLII